MHYIASSGVGNLVIHLFIFERDGIFSDLLVFMDDLNYVEHYKQVQ